MCIATPLAQRSPGSLFELGHHRLFEADHLGAPFSEVSAHNAMSSFVTKPSYIPADALLWGMDMSPPPAPIRWPTSGADSKTTEARMKDSGVGGSWDSCCSEGTLSRISLDLFATKGGETACVELRKAVHWRSPCMENQELPAWRASAEHCRRHRERYIERESRGPPARDASVSSITSIGLTPARGVKPAGVSSINSIGLAPACGGEAAGDLLTLLRPSEEPLGAGG